MHASEFQHILRISPFTPIRIFLTAGAFYDVHPPDQVLVNRGRLDISVTRWGTPTVDYVSLLHVTRVEAIFDDNRSSQTAQPSQN